MVNGQFVSLVASSEARSSLASSSLPLSPRLLRSLIALSLIMSLLQFKPAPMYILDEIDAALDLSHTQHIGQLFRNRFKGSQFIVVSLKEGLFTNANVLFKAKVRTLAPILFLLFFVPLGSCSLFFFLPFSSSVHRRNLDSRANSNPFEQRFPPTTTCRVRSERRREGEHFDCDRGRWRRGGRGRGGGWVLAGVQSV